jgi:LysM repeat protein
MGLTNLFDGLGEVAKLKIIAYQDDEYSERATDVPEFTAMYNPNTFSQNYRSVWVGDEQSGGSGEQQRFRRLESDSVSFEFLLDGTGVSHVGNTEIDLESEEKRNGHVQDQIDTFFLIARSINGTTHEPNFLELSWGTFIFQGVLESANVTYKLFHSSGAPIRATINATFKESVSPTVQAAEKGLTSPDLTHMRLVEAGETLPSIAKKIYGDPALYLEIARVNNLNNIRKLKVGQELVLPPVNKKENARK